MRSPQTDGSAHDRVLSWYRTAARELPWRAPDIDGWHVLVSEIMLQQTPVARVLPVYEAWTARWPTPSALAEDSPGEAVRMWGRLGYPRRALRLHEAATVVDREHEGVVPADVEVLRSLPGVGEYTASAVAAFAYGRRTVVLDTNVRRVLARAWSGTALPPRSLTRAERTLAEAMLPADGAVAAAWSVGLMELGALLCAASPKCAPCPIRDSCAWRENGYPPASGPARRAQAYAGTDRQCRGRILAVLRDADGDVPRAAVEAVWDDVPQRERALASLIDDGLVVEAGEGSLRLPG
jgi:A/G-specific adenine glycosylase